MHAQPTRSPSAGAVLHDLLCELVRGIVRGPSVILVRILVLVRLILVRRVTMLWKRSRDRRTVVIGTFPS
jgi:hypothetical protein